MRKLVCCAASAAALIFAATAADTAQPQKKVAAPGAKTSAAPATKAPAPKTTVAPKTGASKQGASKTSTAARRTSPLPRRSTTSWRNRQVAPTPDRYKEIQEALVAKGYLQPEDASGRWDPSSIEAMKRFQAEQKLDSTGKINSLSLIALGLGPKHESPAAPKPADTPNGQR
jgi:hypothetical protein